MRRRPPRSTRTDTLFPYTTLFRSIICVGLNYKTHREETGRAETENPALFVRFADSQTAHLQPLVKPKASDKLDYEGELAVIIGKAGRHVPAEKALDIVAGYARSDERRVGKGWFRTRNTRRA